MFFNIRNLEVEKLTCGRLYPLNNQCNWLMLARRTWCQVLMFLNKNQTPSPQIHVRVIKTEKSKQCLHNCSKQTPNTYQKKTVLTLASRSRIQNQYSRWEEEISPGSVSLALDGGKVQKVQSASEPQNRTAEPNRRLSAHSDQLESSDTVAPLGSDSCGCHRSSPALRGRWH